MSPIHQHQHQHQYLHLLSYTLRRFTQLRLVTKVAKCGGPRINGVLWPRETTKTLLLQLILFLSSSSYSSNRTSSSSSCSSAFSSSSFSSSCHLPYTTAKCTIKRSQTAQMWRKHARGESAQETTKGERPRERRQREERAKKWKKKKKKRRGEFWGQEMNGV